MNLRKAAMPKPIHREQRAEVFCRLKMGTEFQRIPEGGELGKHQVFREYLMFKFCLPRSTWYSNFMPCVLGRDQRKRVVFFL